MLIRAVDSEDLQPKMSRQLANIADAVRSWISENWNTPAAATTVAVATTTGFAVAYLWKTDRTFQNWARELTAIGIQFDDRVAARKRKLFQELETMKDVREDGRLALLEIGCGGGTNFRYYPAGSEVICVEPNRHFEATLYERAGQCTDVRILALHVSPAENLREVQSGSIDAVVSTQVLCSVRDLDQCLQEVIRVLKPGGKFFFLEHVKSPPEFYVIRFCQTLLDFVWPHVYYGCRLSRTTQDNIRKAGFSSVDIEEFEAHEIMQPPKEFWGMRLVRSNISGIATK